MKQKLLTVAIAAAAAFSMNTMADVTVYGKANLSLNQYDEADTVKVNSNASRVGVKGSYGISGSTKAVYKLEYAYGADDGADGDFEARNIYAGFAGDWGMFAAGRHDTPLKMAQGKVDRFNDLPLGDIKNVVVGEARANNTIWYASPKANGLQGIIALVQGENIGNKKHPEYDEKNDDNNGIGDAISASLTYNSDSFYAALAIDSEVPAKMKDAAGKTLFKNVATDTVRLVGEYKAEQFKIGALIQQSEPSDGKNTEDTDAFLLSAEFDVAPMWKLKAQYSQAETGDAETQLVSFGVDRKLNKKSKVFAYFSDYELDYGVSGTKSSEENTFGIGYEVKF